MEASWKRWPSGWVGRELCEQKQRKEGRFCFMLLFFLSAHKIDLKCQSEELDLVSATL